MEIDEILGRCEVCGFISQESNVRQHMRVHQSPVELDEDENYSHCDELTYNTCNQNDGKEVEIDVFQEENAGIVLDQMNKNDESYDKLYWSTPQVQLLIQLYDKNKLKFDDKKTRNKKVWKSIAEEMGIISKLKVTTEQCENKFKNLRKTYKKIIDNNSSTGRGAKNWPFFKDMDLIFSKDPDVDPISTCSNLEGSSHVTGENINTSNQNVQENNIRGVKRKKPYGEEPEWFMNFREDCQKRHEEKMKRQDSQLHILEKLSEK
ncbi:hypothetical protein JTB14_009550 [Gonioctena quinquepunctata]|nr:hypothetical protein JTB14_009550 [Gonioctena quinquepunctata]